MVSRFIIEELLWRTSKLNRANLYFTPLHLQRMALRLEELPGQELMLKLLLLKGKGQV